MRLPILLFAATLIASPVAAQPASSADGAKDQATEDQGPTLPVSVAKIREALETTPVLSLRTADETPTFRVQIHERQKLDELLAALNFKTGPIPAGGSNMAEQDRIMFPSVDNPLRQPFAAFNQPQLLTVVIENLVGQYLGGKAAGAITRADRAHAESVARDEVRGAIAQYCTSQPNNGAGIQICDTPIR